MKKYIFILIALFVIVSAFVSLSHKLFNRVDPEKYESNIVQPGYLSNITMYEFKISPDTYSKKKLSKIVSREVDDFYYNKYGTVMIEVTTKEKKKILEEFDVLEMTGGMDDEDLKVTFKKGAGVTVDDFLNDTHSILFLKDRDLINKNYLIINIRVQDRKQFETLPYVEKVEIIREARYKYAPENL